MEKVAMNAVDEEGFSLQKSGTFKILGGSKVIYEDTRFGFSRERLLHVIAPKNFTRTEAVGAINAMLFYQCGHVHDCCGCISSYAYGVEPTGKGREYAVSLVESRNV